MAKKATLSSVPNISNNASSVNENLEKINNQLDNTLSLDGSTPNAMTADLDLNGNSVLNVSSIDTEVLTINGSPVGLSNQALLSFDTRSATNIQAAKASLSNGEVFLMDGLPYRVDTSKTGTSSVTNDLSEAGIDSEEPTTFRHFGATGDGTTDDTAAIDAAEVARPGEWIYLEADKTYTTTASVASLLVNTYGPGTLKTTESSTLRPRAHKHLSVLAPVSSQAPSNSILTGFDGDFQTLETFGVYITGADTAGTPSADISLSEYDTVEETSADVCSVLFDSGKNQSFFNTAGRTGWYGFIRNLTHDGAGDAFIYRTNVLLTAKDATVNRIHGAPAGGVFGGTIQSSDDDVVLQGLEWTFDDNGNDNMTKAIVLNFKRDNSTAAKDQFWTGIRLNSKGTEDIDAGLHLVGGWKNGVDLTGGTFDRAVSLTSGDGIHFEVTTGLVYGTTAWTTSEAVTSGDYREYEGNVYQASTSGTTGATPPTHSSGTVSDGAVDWDHAYTHAFKSYGENDAGTHIKVTSSKLWMTYRNTSMLGLDGSNVDVTPGANGKHTLRVFGSSATEALAFGNEGVASYITALSNSTANTSLILRTAKNGTEQSVLTLDQNKLATFAGDVSVPTKTPATAAATGTAGTITWDADYVYVCTATDTWKRSAIATW